MSNRHPTPQWSVNHPLIRGGLHAFGGIGTTRKQRRTALYRFLTAHKDGRGITEGSERHRFYLECVEAARALSRTKRYTEN